jgi:hypothetical protein
MQLSAFHIVFDFFSNFKNVLKTSNARRFDSLDPRLNDKISVYCFGLLQKLVIMSNVSLYVRYDVLKIFCMNVVSLELYKE